MAPSLFSQISYYGNWVVSGLGFIYWTYQIIRSGILYYKHDKDSSAREIMVLHFCLFVANALYLAYEVNYTFTPIFFTMVLLTDITGIWCFNLVMNNDQGGSKMMSAKRSKFVDFMMGTLVVIYIGSYFLPSHWGVRCSEHAPPLGTIALTLFYIVWTFHSVSSIRNDPLLRLKEQSWRELIAMAKQLSLKEYEGEFNHQGMVLAQRQMYMLTTALNLVIQILLVAWKTWSFVAKLEFDDSVKAQCTGDWYFKDSSVTMLLVCFMISMPIQQFTSCFYVIPMEHKFFEQSKEQLEAQGEKELKMHQKEKAFQQGILTANSAEILSDDGFAGNSECYEDVSDEINDEEISRDQLVINSSRNPSKKGKNVGFDKEVTEKEKQKELAKNKARRARAKRQAATNTSNGGSVSYVSRRKKEYEDSASDLDQNDQDYIDSQSGGNKDTGGITYMDTRGNKTTLKPNIRFQSYKNVFTDLLKQTNVITMYPIVSMIITNDSSRAVTLTKKDDHTYFLKMYGLETYEMTFEEKIGGGPGAYIKVKEIQQNQHGSEFAVVYLDDGRFYLRNFKKTTRTKEEIKDNEVNLNEVLGINDYTMANECFPDPYISCCFVNDDHVFIDIFYNYKLTHYHFIWDLRLRRMVGKRGKVHLDCNKANFPYACFFSEERQMIYSFYRQGQCFLVNPKTPNKFTMEKIIDKDLGQMIMFGGECLIVRSSGNIYFFKQVVDKMTKHESWKLFHTIHVRGFIYYIKGNIRIQVTTENLVYFYIINKDTFMPELENVMTNYMGCNQMMFGKKVRYGITYKTNQRSFDIYRRKFMHNLKVCVQNDQLEGGFGISMPSLEIFLVAKKDEIKVYDSNTFAFKAHIPIKLLVTETREPNEIIGICKSKCNRWIACISGKNLVMNNQAQNQLFLFRIDISEETGEESFEQVDRIVVKEIPFFQGVCMKYFFVDFKAGTEPQQFLFCKATEIFKMNIKDRTFETVHKFSPALLTQPQYYCTSDDQKIHVLASTNDGIWYSEEEDKEVDLDVLYKVDNIKDITFDEEDKEFYFLSNKKNGFIGFFLIKFIEKDPHQFTDLTMWKHRLDIDNCNLFILRGHDHTNGKHYKELIISYKTILINTFNVVVQDISGPVEKRATLYIHESFQLWESKITGLMLEKGKDFLSISKGGINVLALGSEPKRHMIDNEGQDKMIHALDSLSFLKIDAINYIKFECQDYNHRVISVEQEYRKAIPGLTGQFETHFQSVYKIKISEVTLRELMILQSFYLCKTQAEIVNLVEVQPAPALFYKAFLELDLATLVSILAFDSKSVQALLGDHNEAYFDEKFPIIYKNKIPKKHGKKHFYYRTAIDNALRNNQIQSVNLMINYICKYQNNYVSAKLFYKQIPILLNKGVECTKLFESRIFQYDFDYDEWPSNHYNNTECIRAYNGSIFRLRANYHKVFPEPEFEPIPEHHDHSKEEENEVQQKVYKIMFQINLLPSIGQYKIADPDNEGKFIFKNEDVSLMDLAAETTEMRIFNTESLGVLIQYKWEQYGKIHHIFGSVMHLFYTICIIIYVNKIYLQNETDLVTHFYYTMLLLVGVFYPWIYDLVQFIKDGPRAYFSDPWNYVDFFYIYGSLSNIVCQTVLGQFHIVSEILMIMIILLLTVKTFFFLRIIESFTPIVIMLINVIYDLRIFLLFYGILLFMYSLLFSVIGIGLSTVQQDDYHSSKTAPAAARLLQAVVDPKNRGGGGFLWGLRVAKAEREKDNPNPDIPELYQYLGMFIGNFIWTFRLSLGDYDLMGEVPGMPFEENVMFWIVWVLSVTLTSIIFLNFIIAEASATYIKVADDIDAIIAKERVSMIKEAEDMTRTQNKTEVHYPPYLIVRSTPR